MACVPSGGKLCCVLVGGASEAPLFRLTGAERAASLRLWLHWRRCQRGVRCALTARRLVAPSAAPVPPGRSEPAPLLRLTRRLLRA